MGIKTINVSRGLLLTGILITLGTTTVLAQTVATAPTNNDVTKNNGGLEPKIKISNSIKSTASAGKPVDKTLPTTQNSPIAPKAAAQIKDNSSGIVSSKKGNITTVTDNKGWLATYTDGARTVTLRGQQRTFRELGFSTTVTNNVWVRILPISFNGLIDEAWLLNEQKNTNDDVLATALQYVPGSPTLRELSGKIFASDSDFGPLNPDGTRQEGSDFNDYLGINYIYDGVTDSYEIAQSGAMDCSGYMRMVWGYRLGLGLTNEAQARNGALPRRAVQMYETGPGVLLFSQGSNAQASLSNLMPGDLVFFDASTNDGMAVDHVGLYLGIDTQGDHRFISSRKTANGPTISDIGGKSVLNGTGLYAKSFVAARRL